MKPTQPEPQRREFARHSIRFGLFLLPLMLILAACGGQPGPTATVVIRGTSTPIPTSTPLPQVATALPAGFPDNPLRLMLIPQDRERAEALKPQLENAILQSTSVTVEIVFAEDRLELLDALCDTSSETLTAIWADALTYSVASARRCGDATIWLERNGSTGDTRKIVLSSSLSSRNVQSLRNETFCRVSRSDLDTWLMPVLLLQGNRVDVSTFADVKEYPDTTMLLNAVALGECAGAGVASSTLAAWQAANPGAADSVVSVLESVPIPYGVLMYPFQIPVAARLALTNELPNLAAVMLPTPTPTSTPELTLTAEGGATAEATQETAATADATESLATAEAASTSEAAAATQEAANTASATQEATVDATDTASATQETSATAEASATREATANATAEIEAALTAEPTQAVTAEPEATAEAVEAAQDTETLLAPFVGPGKLVALGVDDLKTLDDFLASSGLNFSQLGQ